MYPSDRSVQNQTFINSRVEAETVKYRKLDGIEKELSVLIYGTPGTACAKQYRDLAFQSYDLAWEAGFRAFDTAHSYGDGEETLGAWLQSRGVRDQAVILDKGCNPGQKGSTDTLSAETIRKQLEQSLERLQTDFVEFYLLHRDDPDVAVDEIIEELNEEQQKGRILRFGVSNWSLQRIQAANAYAEKHHLSGFTGFSPAYSLAVYLRDPWGGSVALSGAAQAPYRAWLEKTGLPVFCYSSLGRGLFSGAFKSSDRAGAEKALDEFARNGFLYDVNLKRLARAEEIAARHGCPVATVAMAYLLTDPMNTLAVVSMSRPERIQANLKVFDFEFAPGERESLAAILS